ncbi:MULTISPECIES: hypothetical protein [Kitasatospora]|uniref:Uncharacterized protein n=1 Tax=Kitasatospora setae (strain ATCC 33774 / DSM 43861 / JCM 3304 / KCC A-0304 / NBRC 14216 / KM-6054) TaxID=452652 RepID=E4N268_KITSK|nr:MULTISPECIES: hypothetical protein [Kitasatospora]BAJ32252.1 hypothetical protein KSE_64920 [Kitasatospora setae KM-6054]
MSEPYSAMARLHLEPAALRSYLAAPSRPWTGWGELTGRYDRSGEAGGLPWSMHPGPDSASVERWLTDGDDHRAQLRAFLRTAEEPGLAAVEYDEAARTLTVVNLTVHRESFRDPLWFLSVIGGAAEHVGAQGGFAVVRDHIWPGPDDRYTLGVLTVAPSGARALHPVRDSEAYRAAVRTADAVFDTTGLPVGGDDPEEWAGLDPVECLDAL